VFVCVDSNVIQRVVPIVFLQQLLRVPTDAAVMFPPVRYNY